MRILVVEDETKVRNFIHKALSAEGMVVDAVVNRTELIGSLKTYSYEAIVLDRMVSGRDLLDSLSEIRHAAPKSKILVLSALSEVEDKVKGLTEGADDYLGKPFHIAELVARVRTLTRRGGERQNGAKDTLLIYEDLKIDLETQRVIRQDKKIDLTAKEYRLLCLMVRHPGKIFSRMELLDQAWDMNHSPESNVVEVTIASLRSKVDKAFKPLIQNRRGAGYWIGEP
ncbi:MAG: response regulator transcription factor [Deltaproteobacteria bacterium]|nr:response regulator transcription factor [Deltaproteobacteria bacterium]